MIKLLAILTMLADHWSILVLADETGPLRHVGRIAFPLFAAMVARNVGLSRDPDAYIRRMLLWGVIAQPVVWVVLDYGLLDFNVLFSLALIAGAALALERSAWLQLLLLVLLGHWCAYGIPGVAFGVAIAGLCVRPQLWPIWLGSVFSAALLLNPPIYVAMTMFAAALAALVCVPQVVRWDRAAGVPIPAMFFYWFYPAHLVALAII